MDPMTWGGDVEGIVITAAPGMASLAVAGELDTHGATFFAEAIDAVLAAPVDVVRLDLGEVAFIDSAGLSALLRARSAFQGAGRELVVGGASPVVSRLVELAGVDDLLADGRG